jgi:4'-phosphopantetheinyl transferase
MQIVWPRLTAVPRLTGTDVHVWAVPLRVGSDRLAALRALLSPDEIAKADRIVVPGKREQSAVARGTLRELLAEYTGIAARELEFEYEEKGRPFLADGSLATAFNVTHSGDLALIAVTREGVIGVDVERIDPKVELLAIGERFFSATEHAQLSACSEEDRPLAFFRCWTRKESYLKARGTGLTTPLDQFDVTLLDGDPPQLLETRFDPGDAARWTLTELMPAPGYPGALCADRAPRNITGFFWDRV